MIEKSDFASGNATPQQDEMADSLLNVSGTNKLRKPERPNRSGYIPLCIQLSKSKRNKNAVSIHKNYVSFMVPDWSLESQALALHFKPEQSTTFGKRLHFNNLTPAQVRSNIDFFASVLQIAMHESVSRQTSKRRNG